MLSRKEIREAAWRKPGWDECVAYTGLYLTYSFQITTDYLHFEITIISDIFLCTTYLFEINSTYVAV